jgi:single-stranded-DNA-specific exonuclease
VIKHCRPTRPAAIDVIGEPEFAAGVLAEMSRDLAAPTDDAAGLGRPYGGAVAGLGVPQSGAVAGAVLQAKNVSDRRGAGIAGLLADLVAAGEPVLAIVAHAPHRARTLERLIGGFAMCSWGALDDDPELAAPFAHLVAVDPPAEPRLLALLERPSGTARGHLAWGEPELGFARRIHQWDFALREPLTTLYRALRGRGEVGGEALEAALRGEGPQPRSAALAGRLVRVLSELDLAALDREGQALRLIESPRRTALEHSPAFRAYHRRLEDGLRYLTSDTIRQAA